MGEYNDWWWAKSCDFSLSSQEKMRRIAGVQNREVKNQSKTYIDHVFLEGGKIIQLPPTEVVASGGRWGSGGQDQQSCGHKMKLHSSVGQNSIQSRRSSMRGGGSES